MKKSRSADFFKLDEEKKLEIIADFADLTEEEVKIIKNNFDNKRFRNQISENVIGTLSLPYSVAPNFLINGKDYFVPMVTEEPSVVAAASYGGKLSRESGGTNTKALGSLMIGQIYIKGIKKINLAEGKILRVKKEILEEANKQDPVLIRLGGGAKDLEVKVFDENKTDSILRIHLLVDVKDAMGANIINRMAEAVAPLIERVSGGKSLINIVSNLADKRLMEAKVVISKKSLEEEGLDSKKVISDIIESQQIAEKDIYRAVTHNKGIMNGMGAVALATGNDWRALEAAAHGYASLGGRYKPLTDWGKDKEGNLVGKIVAPVSVGIVGGATNIHPLSEISFKILKVDSAEELASVVISVGLVQNLAALKALVSEGIQAGHRKVQAENLAFAAGARGDEIEKIAELMIKIKDISLESAEKILKSL